MEARLWDLYLFAGLSWPLVAGFDGRVGDCDQWRPHPWNFALITLGANMIATIAAVRE